jgi:hypothetical protein
MNTLIRLYFSPIKRNVGTFEGHLGPNFPVPPHVNRNESPHSVTNNRHRSKLLVQNGFQD